MKRDCIHIVLFLSALVIFSSCRKEPPEPFPYLPPIEEAHSIGVRVEGVQSKGEVISSPNQILSLGIFGYSTGTDDFDHTNPAHKPNLFANREVTRSVIDEETESLSPWVYDPVSFWPSNDNEKNTFFAYAPHENLFPDGPLTVVTDEDSYGYPIIQYTVPETISEQIDVLYSEYNDNVKNINYNDTNSGRVKYKMKHAMVWIRFIIAAVIEVVDEDTGEPIEDSGETYTILEFNFVADRIINTAQFNLGTGTWSIMPEIGDDGYESGFYEFDHLYEEDEEGNFGMTVPAGFTAPLGGTTTCLMMIPQNIVMSENFTSVNVLFTHDNGSENPINTEFYQTMPFPDVRLTSAGSVMTYVVKLSTKGSHIEFVEENTIDKWLEDEEEREVEVF